MLYLRARMYEENLAKEKEVNAHSFEASPENDPCMEEASNYYLKSLEAITYGNTNLDTDRNALLRGIQFEQRVDTSNGGNNRRQRDVTAICYMIRDYVKEKFDYDMGPITINKGIVEGRKYTCDIVFEKFKLAIEVNGTSHKGRIEYDNEKDKAYRDNGYEVIRITPLKYGYPVNASRFIDVPERSKNGLRNEKRIEIISTILDLLNKTRQFPIKGSYTIAKRLYEESIRKTEYKAIAYFLTYEERLDLYLHDNAVSKSNMNQVIH